VLRLMNSEGLLIVRSLLRSTAAVILRSKVSNSSDPILDFPEDFQLRMTQRPECPPVLGLEWDHCLAGILRGRAPVLESLVKTAT
jgi:hypothetical protein